MEASVFRALGEPSRLRIIELLRTGAFSVGDIADALGIRQPQVSKHLRVLSDAGLVAGEFSARRRMIRLEPEAFVLLGSWADSFERLWDDRLDSLGRYLDRTEEKGIRNGEED